MAITATIRDLHFIRSAVPLSVGYPPDVMDADEEYNIQEIGEYLVIIYNDTGSQQGILVWSYENQNGRRGETTGDGETSTVLIGDGFGSGNPHLVEDGEATSIRLTPDGYWQVPSTRYHLTIRQNMKAWTFRIK